MKTNDCQQLVSGFRTVEIIGGPLIVRVHESMDLALSHTPHRFFVSVDLKFKASDALNIGNLGYYGCTKGEAAKEAKALARRIYVAHGAMTAANEAALNWDTFTNRHTAKIQSERFNSIIAKYNAEFVES